MSNTLESILAALSEYRTYIASQNRLAVELYANFAQNATPPADEDENEEELEDFIQQGRMDFMSSMMGDVSKYNTPLEVLQDYDQLVLPLGMDGTYRMQDLNEEEREQRRENYFSAIQAGLRERSLPELRGTIAIPEGFRIMAQQVDGLHGPLLEHHYGMRGVPFWEGLMEEPDKYQERVKSLEDLKNRSGMDDWVVGGGWETGHGSHASCCVVYVRSPEEKTNAWSWKYVINQWENGLEVFDNIPELLEHYKHFEELDLSDVPEYSEEDIWSGVLVLEPRIG